MDKIQRSKFSELSDVVHRIWAPYFILKRNRFLTTVIFTASASTVHNSLKIMFIENSASKFHFLCYPGYDICLSVMSIPFLE